MKPTQWTIVRVLQNPRVQQGLRWAAAKLGLMALIAVGIYLLPLPETPTWAFHVSLWLKAAGFLTLPILLLRFCQRADKTLRAERDTLNNHR